MLVPRPSWKRTLHLPKSAFPPRPKVSDRPTYIKRCTDDLYKWQKDRHPTPTYTLHDGPPYANGDLHIGHALNKILKDVTCRIYARSGRVDWVPGWDCHGLPIELIALQEQGKKPGTLTEKADPVNTRDAARRLATKTVERQKKSFREWAIMADWDNAWTTMDKGFEIDQLHVFKEMVKKGLVYRRFKPVYWSPSSRTALAEAELEYREDHVSAAAFIQYPLHDCSDTLKEKLKIDIQRLSAVIWTTTPWTLPANRAIAFHKDIEYEVVHSVVHGYILLAASRIDELRRHLNDDFKTLISIHGKELVGTTYRSPVFDSQASPRPLLHGDFVTEGSGSGLVHVAPGHGMEDYELCLHYGIPAFAPVDDKGCFTDGMEWLSGQEVLTTGNESVLKRLSDRGCLIARHSYKHKYPYDWRSKQPVIVRATAQWFANVGSIQNSALKALDSVKFIPTSSKTRLQTFVKNRKEWCISRQRAWGVPIPALYNIDTNEALLTETSVSHIIAVIKERGIDSWWTDSESDPAWTPPSLRNSANESSYRRGKDTMDVWFDSGTSWTQMQTSLMDYHNTADFYIEGTDQHRGWFQSSLLTHVAYQTNAVQTERQDGQAIESALPSAPYKTLITHGFVLDQDGRKMSKSVGNVVSPSEIMEGTLLPSTKKKISGKLTEIRDSMGPDALRLWVASCDYTTDIRVSQTMLQAVNGSLSKYRVTFKLLLGILNDFDPSTCSECVQEASGVHQFALLHLLEVVSRVEKHYHSMEFNRAVADINAYINTNLSSFYFESIKDAAYCGTIQERAQVQTTLYWIFTELQQMLLPVTPLLIEEVWDYTPKLIKDYDPIPPAMRRREDLSLLVGQDMRKRLSNSDIPPLMRALAAVRIGQEAARNDKKMGDSLQSYVSLQVVATSVATNPALDLLKRYHEELETLFVVSHVSIVEEGTASKPDEARWFYYTDCEIQGQTVRVYVHEPDQAKCNRCWRYKAPLDVPKEEALCHRCVLVVDDLKDRMPGLFGSDPHTRIADGC